MSVKSKITLWYVLLLGAMSLIMLGFSLSISSRVTEQSARDTLLQIAEGNLHAIAVSDGKLQLGETFLFSQSGVSSLVYSSKGALLAGQLPVGFSVEEPFEKEVIRKVDAGAEDYYVLDLWYPIGWEDGMWLRSLMEAPERGREVGNLLAVAGIVLPFFMVLSALGGYLIVRRAFLPLEHIIRTAEEISETSDLSARIGVTKGSREFTRLASTFDQMIGRLESSFEREKQFTSDASHELRTPVSVIKGACEYAMKFDETEEERQETITMIYRQTMKMSNLITALLRITRMEQGTEAAQLQRLNLFDFLRGFQSEQGEGTERLTISCPPALTIQADPMLLSRLLQNLVNNAVKYGGSGKPIAVTAAETEEETTLSVADEGDGIPPEALPHIWQRFYQVDGARSGEGGAGLGLSMVEMIAHLHGGFMTAESTLGEGSIFTLHLPKKS